MADQQVPEQYNMVYTLGVQPGIKRDGTVFEAREYSDGLWCRFQRGRPKKMGGYRTIFNTFDGILRGMITNAYNGVNYIFGGTKNDLQVFTTGTTIGIGSGPFNANIKLGYSGRAVTAHTSSSVTVTGDQSAIYPAGTKICFSQAAGSTVYTVSSTSVATNTTINFLPAVVGTFTPTNVYIADYSFSSDQRNLWQFDLQYSPLGGALQVLAHPGLNLDNIDNGVESPVYIGNVLPNSSNEWNFEVLADTEGANPTYRPITADGGVCVLYPFIFVYGANGFIANNNVDSTDYVNQSPNDWNGPLANQVNMSSAKIVKGMPTRGGTNAPSGLFWATDSLIRVSFTGSAPNYWRYDIVSSQISIMSSSSVVEMDGLYYWMGVDRFYVYNGQVNVLDNQKNVNWLFDNLNYSQRQKVWATKVPRYNEIWFFYPRGQNTECTDAIIYNVNERIWYDAGSADGARRSCGYTTEIFPTPIWAGWDLDISYSTAFTIVDNPPSLAAPTNYQFYLEGDQTNGFAPGSYTAFSKDPGTTVYKIVSSQHIYNATIGTPGVTLVTVATEINPYVEIGNPAYFVQGGYTIWQQEFGLNKVTLTDEVAIQSSFTTCDISWVGGTPSNDTDSGVNRRMHLRRIEPDFVQSGDLRLTILGRKFAQGETTEEDPFVFGPNDGKIDMRVEHREVRFQFESNTLGGNYEMGRLLITSEFGDERP